MTLAATIAKISLITLATTSGLALLDHWLWIPELLSHFKLQYLLAATILAIAFAILRETRWTAISLAIMILHLTALAPLYAAKPNPQNPQTTPRQITIAQFNIHGHVNKTPDAILHWLAQNSRRFDIVQLQEVPPSFGKRLQKLARHYPHQFFEKPTPERWKVSGLVLLARIPLENVQTQPLSQGKNFFIRADIKSLNAAFYGVHNYNPIRRQGARERNAQILEVARAIGKDRTRHRILAGDLNLTPYSSWHDRLENLSGLRNTIWGFGAQNSFPSWALLPDFMRPVIGIPIDHILVSPNVIVRSRETGPALGSDHFPVITKLELP